MPAAAPPRTPSRALRRPPPPPTEAGLALRIKRFRVQNLRTARAAS